MDKGNVCKQMDNFKTFKQTNIIDTFFEYFKNIFEYTQICSNIFLIRHMDKLNRHLNNIGVNSNIINET